MVNKRKQGQPSTACQNCRARKVKCVLLEPQSQLSRHSESQRCQPCQNSNLDCYWDGIDGRRRRRQRRFSSGQSLPESQPRPNVAEDANRSLGFLEPCLSPGERSIADSAENSGKANHLESPGRAPVLIPAFASVQGPSKTSLGFDGTEEFLAEFCADQDIGPPQDWPDFQNLVLGLDFMGNVESTQGRSRVDYSPLTARLSSTGPPQRVIKLRYYRRFGPTAVVPGLRRLSVIVDPEEDEPLVDGDDRPEMEERASHFDNSSPGSTMSNQSKLFDKSSRAPHPHMMSRILDIFFEKFGGHFPFLNPHIPGGHLQSGEASSFLLNAIAALTMRFCSFEEFQPIINNKKGTEWRRGAPFLKKAKEQLVPLLSIPAPEVVAGLLILAWADFGDNNEAGKLIVSNISK